MLSEKSRDALIARTTHRRHVYDLLPDNPRKVLDFGCGEGGLLLRLMRDKGARGLFGLETNQKLTGPLSRAVDGVFHTDLEQDEGHLPPEFTGFFEHIIAHDVLEHLVDPWYTLAKLRSYLADDGTLYLATPNAQYWEVLHTLLSGDFPYGPGLWHTGHLRWYTARSLVELTAICGLEVKAFYLEIPYELDAAALLGLSEIREVRLPPQEIAARHADRAPLGVSYPYDVARAYPLFLAHKLILVCGKRTGAEHPPRRFGYRCKELAHLRELMATPFDMRNPPPFTLLTGAWS